MGRWRVFYADWQMECCGTPFSVGDEVNWPLLLRSSQEVLGGGWSEELSKISAPVERVHDEDGVIQVLRADDGLLAALHGDPVDASGLDPDQWIRAVGLLTVERHGIEWPGTTGRVGAIHVVHQGYVETDPASRALLPDPEDRSLEAVDRCPQWFGGDYDESRTRSGVRRFRRRSGVLVELDVPDPRT
ncbi:hypothetical protein GCM10011579_075110 [Streptomyces albiflavescens]|uniref:Uncharacterized protein n=1 Tax=Streptomyces albiflavescens TaxID=1623582 RepID=A0A918D8I7_9ACTN|nr:DUF6578 domain-containing protein [Streptomyces albiflavescens]GGN84792.1 hypothetical protein GCM10011579_075110 [Streptomyces albiflavescens]